MSDTISKEQWATVNELCAKLNYEAVINTRYKYFIIAKCGDLAVLGCYNYSEVDDAISHLRSKLIKFNDFDYCYNSDNSDHEDTRLREKLDELEQENKKLKEDITDHEKYLESRIKDLGKEIKRLEELNTKLISENSTLRNKFSNAVENTQRWKDRCAELHRGLSTDKLDAIRKIVNG